jgi:hypothetical protein
MEDLRTACSIISPGDYLMKIDLKKAYHQLPIQPSHRKFLGIKIANQYYRYNVLPFGVSQAPYALTKALKPAISEIRKAGIRATIYLDDLLIATRDPQHGRMALEILNQFGWKANLDKSILTPVKRIEFLGATLDTDSMTLSITEEFKMALIAKLQLIANANQVSRKFIQQIKGSLAWAARFNRMIRALSHQILLKRQEVTTHLKQVLFQLISLLSSLPPTPIQNMPHLIVTTDSSDYAVGATLSSTNGSIIDTISQALTKKQRMQHIVKKEAMALIKAIETWRSRFEGKVVSFYIDNRPLCYAMRKAYSPSKKLQPLILQMTQMLQIASFTWFFPIRSEDS